MSEIRMLLDEIQNLKRRLQALETRQEHPGFAASDVARKSLTLAQFAATTSAQLAGVLSDETGYGVGASAVFSNSPVFVTQISTPAIVAPAALTVTPAAGNGVAIVLSGAGDFSVNTDDFYVDTSTGRIGVGTAAPSALFDVVSDAQATFKFSTASDTATTASQIQLVRSRGTNASPSILSGGDLLGTILFRGYNTAQVTSASIRAEADGEWGTAGDTSDQPGRVIIATVANGASSLTDRVVVNSAGNMGVNVDVPLAKLDVRQASTSATIPTMYFQQADVSEEFFEFDTTIGTGNAIEAVGAKVLTTTHFIKVTLPGALTRYFPVGTIA